MTTDTESVPGAGEVPVPPVPAFSDKVSESAPASQSVDYDKLAEKLNSQIEAAVEKRFQSSKDKRFADLEKIKRYLDANGGDPAKAHREMRMDEILAAETVSGLGGGTPGQGTSEQVQRQIIQKEVGELLTEAGIPYVDPEYTALVAKDWTSPAHFQKEVTRMVAKRAKQANNPGLAAAAGDGAGASPVNTNLDALYAALRTAQISNNVAERKRLSALIREKGGVA